ncbi:MAG: glycoside hydrolase family protein [Hydrogenimonas sp.]|nr:glycoside hydrolase family protein [Hydrogenimonas sp.]
MSTTDIVSNIKKYEGFRGMPYDDSLGFPTIGYGTKLPIDKDEAELLLKKRLNDVRRELESRVDFFYDLPEEIQAVLLDMAYNMGVPRLFTFKKMWEAVRDRDWERMADEMVDSLWYRQVGRRAEELAGVVRRFRSEELRHA